MPEALQDGWRFPKSKGLERERTERLSVGEVSELFVPVTVPARLQQYQSVDSENPEQWER